MTTKAAEKAIVTADIKKAEATIKRVEAIEQEILDLISIGGPTTMGMSCAHGKSREAITECRSQLINFIEQSNNELHYLDFEERDAAKRQKAA